MNFKSWFIIVESKEEKALALELAGNPSTLSSLSEVIPQGTKETDPLLLLSAYYYSKNKDVEQIKTDMRDYIGFLKNNRMSLIKVDLISKEPPNPWKDYLYWTEAIHGHQGEDAAKKASVFRPSDIDFQSEVPFMKSPDGKIKVYKAHSPQQCIILGKGQSFCISQPGNRMWQSYRDKNTSTFYFVYDDTRNDRLSIVVVDKQGDGRVELTDKVNRTGTTLDPYTNEETTNSDSYMRYLAEKGIEVSKMVNVPKSEEEVAEDKKLGKEKSNLIWFQSLSYDERSKYIGRGHLLSNEQFDYLWENKFVLLLTQYVKTGLKLPNYQIDKISSNRDLRDNYIHNRLIANQQYEDLNKKEFDLLRPDQKKKFFDSWQNVIKFGELKDVKNLVENETNSRWNTDATEIAAKNNRLDVLKYLVDDKKFKIGNYAVMYAAEYGHFEVVKYLIQKGASIHKHTLFHAIKNGHLEIVKYILENFGYDKTQDYTTLPKKSPLKIIKYLSGDEVDSNGEKIKLPNYIPPFQFGTGGIDSAADGGNFDVLKYLVEKIGFAGKETVYYAANKGYLDILKYLIGEKNAEIPDNAVEYAIESGNFEVIEYLVKNGATIGNALNKAKKSGYLDIANYLEAELNKRRNR